jgi:hypothetical protein
MKTLLTTILCTLGSLLLLSPTANAQEPVFELRIYVCNPGKLEALLDRFRNHTCQLFEKHGMTNIGYWVPIEEEHGASDTLIYVLQHQSREAAKESFAAFSRDPDWVTARKESEKDGAILAEKPTSIFMTRTDYSVALNVEAATPGRTFELRIYETPEGKVAPLHDRFRQHTCSLFEKHGMTNICYWEPVEKEKGAGSMLVYILAHKSHEAGLASFAAFREDPDWIAAKAATEEANGGSLTLPQPEGVRSIYMRPTDFSPMK